MLFHTTKRKVPKLKIEIDSNLVDKLDHFNFLGLEIDTHLNWNTHIKKISGKLMNLIGIISKFKYILPLHTLQTIYTTLIVPHFNYCLLIWGCNMERIAKLQKRAIRIVSHKHYMAHTEPIFKSLNLLKLEDIYIIRLLKFYFRMVNSNCPPYFLKFLQSDNRPHQHNTRTRTNNNLQGININHEFANKSIQYNLIKEINAAPNTFKSKTQTHSLIGYTNYIKTTMINQYSEICSINNCYSCTLNLAI